MAGAWLVKKDNAAVGRKGEQKALEHLQQHGYRILARNFRNKLGEIDIIALQGKEICFIEVKSRTSLAFGMPYEAVNHHKRLKLAQVAQSFLLQKYRTVEVSCRFDVISIHTGPSGQGHLEHIPNAFVL